MNGTNNIENSGSKRNNPFKTGPDYFESFNSKLQSRVEGLEEIKTIAPLLSNIPKYNPFDVPENYFDDLPAIVHQHCTENKSISFIEWLILLIQPRFVIPVLTTLLIAVAGIHFMNKNATSYESLLMAEELTFEEQLYTIDEATIIDQLTADAGTDQSTDDNSIEDYLIDNDIDESNLNSEL